MCSLTQLCECSSLDHANLLTSAIQALLYFFCMFYLFFVCYLKLFVYFEFVIILPPSQHAHFLFRTVTLCFAAVKLISNSKLLSSDDETNTSLGGRRGIGRGSESDSEEEAPSSAVNHPVDPALLVFME